MLKIGVSGHRQLDDTDHIRAAIKQHIEQLLSEKGAAEFEAYSGLAIGADTIFAEVALELGGTLKAVLPFPQEEYEKDFEQPEDRQRLLDLLSRAAEVIVVTQKNPGTPEERNAAYLAYGQKIVNICDIMVLVWDGLPAGGTGGTGDIAAYAKKQGKKITDFHAYRTDLYKHHLLYDDKANRSKQVYEWLWIIGIVLSFAAAVLLAVSLSFECASKHWLAFCELCCILLALPLILYLKISGLNKRRLNYRREAERFRILDKMYKGRLKMNPVSEFKELSAKGKELEEKFLQDPQNADFDHSKEQLMILIEDQLLYHSITRPQKNKFWFHLLERLQFPVLITFCIGVLLHAYTTWHHEWTYIKDWPAIPHWIGLFPCLVLPPLYAAIEGFIYFKEYRKILRESEQMKKFFEGRKEILKNLTGGAAEEEQLNNLADEIRRAMDEEITEWYTTMEIRQIPVS